MTLRERFAEIILNGRSRQNILVSSLVDTMADGTFTNSNTEAMFQHYQRGFEDGMAEVAQADDVLPENEPEPEAPEPRKHHCDWLGPSHANGDETCSVCGAVYDFPF